MGTVLELRDEVLLVAALPSLMHDFVSSQGAVVGDVEEVPNFLEERGFNPTFFTSNPIAPMPPWAIAEDFSANS